MKKTYVPFLLSCLLLQICSAHHTTPLEKVKFENSLLKLIDGIPFCMDGDAIKKSVIVVAKFRHILYGTDPKTRTLSPRYTYNNESHSISSLTMLEEQATAEERKEMQAVLADCIQDLVNEVEPFVEDAKVSLEYNLILIEEWMEKTKRYNTELYDIHNCDEDKMYEYMIDRIHTFEELSVFLEDLISYFESLIQSCPKGVAQFKNLMKQRHHAA